MKKNSEILEELSTLQSSLGDFNEETEALHIPKDYFEHLSEKILADIKAAQSEPEFQFAIEKSGPYFVPENYFEQFPNELLLKVNELETTANATTQSFDNIASKEVLQVPAQYFESFEGELFKKLGLNTATAKEEIESLSPLLAGLQQKTTYSVPDFSTDLVGIIAKAKQTKTEAKVIEHPAVKSIKWARWAAAASIVFIFAIGGINFLGKDASNTTADAAAFDKAFAKIPEAQLKEWLSNNLDEYDINLLSTSIVNNKKAVAKSNLKQLSDEELKDYIENEVW